MPFTGQTFTSTTGTDGRVRNAGTSKIISGISKWRRVGQVNAVPVPHFEAPVDSNNVPFPNKKKGTGTVKFEVEGVYNINLGDGTEVGTTGIHEGSSFTGDFFTSRGSSVGYQNVPGFFTDFQHGQEFEGGKLATFTATFEVDGVCPAFGAIV